MHGNLYNYVVTEHYKTLHMFVRVRSGVPWLMQVHVCLNLIAIMLFHGAQNLVCPPLWWHRVMHLDFSVYSVSFVHCQRVKFAYFGNNCYPEKAIQWNFELCTALHNKEPPILAYGVLWYYIISDIYVRDGTVSASMLWRRWAMFCIGNLRRVYLRYSCILADVSMNVASRVWAAVAQYNPGILCIICLNSTTC